MKFGRSATIAFLGLLVAAPAFGQSASQAPPAPPLPSVDQVLNRYVDAVGGRSAWLMLTSRVATGTIEVPAANLSGTIELREKAPDRILSEIRIAGVLFSQGFDGTVGWIQNVRDGLHEQKGVELSEAKRDADFYHPLDMRKLYTKLTIVGVEKVNDHDTYKMEAEVPDDPPDEIYFDTATGLPARVVSHRHSAQGVVDFLEDFDDYREVDGIKRPFTIHETTGGNVLTIHISEVRTNVFLDDSVFTMPAAQ